jgi:hypothetical protein
MRKVVLSQGKRISLPHAGNTLASKNAPCYCSEPMDAKEMQSAGGKARAEKLTQERKAEIARQAAAVRWKGHVKKPRKDNAGGIAK